MNVKGKHYRTIWKHNNAVFMIDQNLLPFKFKIKRCDTHEDTCKAIKDMTVRGAGAIEAAAGFAMAQVIYDINYRVNYIPLDYTLQEKEYIEKTRPTARNLFYATNRVFNAVKKVGHFYDRDNSKDMIIVAFSEAQKIADEGAEACRKIGEFGNELIKKDFTVLTHCNAGGLAFVDNGTALSPIYLAHKQGKNVSVYVDETRPRSQGARLTAWELKNEKVPYNIIPDNAGAYFMSLDLINMVITGADRIAANGDTANKIGTLEKAIAANEYGIPFYIAAPTSTFDLDCKSGDKITIEYRDEEEVLYQTGPDEKNEMHRILVCSPESPAINPAFDVTPAKYITGIITEKGIIKKPDRKKILSLLNKA